MVKDALENNKWTTFIFGGLLAGTYQQYFHLWDVVQAVQLTLGVSDQQAWTPNASGKFTIKSTYYRFLLGSVTFEPHKRLWKSWASVKVKIFIWMAILKLCWTFDRLARRGLHTQIDVFSVTKRRRTRETS